MRHAACMVLVLLALAGVARAQEPDKRPTTPPATSGARTGVTPLSGEPAIMSQLYVGERAPAFELDGSRGRRVRLTDQRGSWVLLVFASVRGKLGGLREVQADLDTLGVRAFGICNDGPNALKTFAERQALAFELLSDATGEISQLYGLYDSRAGLTQPGFVVVDRRGIVRTAVLGQSLAVKDLLGMVKTSVTGS